MTCSRPRVKVDETGRSASRSAISAVVQLDAFPDTTFLGRVSEISTARESGGHGGTGGATDQAID